MKKVLDILGIVLPVLLIIIGFMRVTGNKGSANSTSRTRMLNSFTMILAVLLLLVGGIRFVFFGDGAKSSNNGPDPEPIAVSAHSDVFNKSFEAVLDAYYQMNEGFVNWDTTVISQQSLALKSALDNFQIDELKKDTIIHLSAIDPLANAKMNVDLLIQAPELEKKREALNSLSENLRNLLLVTKYDQQVVYWQVCPMAFNDEIPGFWLSKNEEIRNPYLGKHHPKYRATMLECGESKGVIVK